MFFDVDVSGKGRLFVVVVGCLGWQFGPPRGGVYCISTVISSLVFFSFGTQGQTMLLTPNGH